MAKTDRQNRERLSSARGMRKKGITHLLDSVFVQFLAFAAFIASIVAILSAGIDDRDFILDRDRIGQVAPQTIEATRDFSYSEKDVVATNRAREEVSRTVPSAYDWQESLGDTIQSEIRQSFAAMREALSTEARTKLEEEDPERLEQLERRSSSPEFFRRTLIDTLNENQRASLAFELRSEHFDPLINARISEEDYDQLARAGFPASVEEALVSTIGEVMSHLIVANPRRFEDERENGIYLRRLRDEQLLIEYHVTDLDGRFVGLEGSSALVQEASQRHLVGIGGASLRNAILSVASSLIRPNTTYNQAQTLQKRQIARESVPDQFLIEEFRQGQVIVDRGHIITERHFRIVEEMHEGEETVRATQILVGMAVFSLLILVILYLFGRRNIRAFHPAPKDIVFMGTTLLAMLLLTRALTAVSHALAEQFGTIPVEAWYFAIPVAAGGMLIRLVLDSEHAIIFTIVFAILVGVIAEMSLFFFAFTMLGTLVGITTVQQVKHRMALMWSGLAVGGINALAVVALLLLQGELFQVSAFAYIFLALGGGLAAGFFISAVLPVFESVFGYTTDIKLLELANMNHPLLRELVLRAPGSYHHSMMVGSLCEAAAEEIGANSLLARVGAYYHDAGKAKNPQYFAENQSGENPHDKLKPNMSALIIKAHVKDGLDMARQHRLPPEMQDFIAQHHGTSLIAYFYHRAKQAEDPDVPEVDEKDYRYPGPKPQTRETAIMLLADGIEAASRAMPNPTPARLKGLVQTMINKAFTDGQLDECDLTLQDLNKIARAFNRILAAIYHHRPEYPGEKKADARKPKTTEEPRKRRDTDKQTEKSSSSPASSSSSDVWEIEEEDTKGNGKENNARRRSDNGSGDGSSSKQSPGRDDRNTPRDDLPRLGTS